MQQAAHSVTAAAGAAWCLWLCLVVETLTHSHTLRAWAEGLRLIRHPIPGIPPSRCRRRSLFPVFSSHFPASLQKTLYLKIKTAFQYKNIQSAPPPQFGIPAFLRFPDFRISWTKMNRIIAVISATSRRDRASSKFKCTPWLPKVCHRKAASPNSLSPHYCCSASQTPPPAGKLFASRRAPAAAHAWRLQI